MNQSILPKVREILYKYSNMLQEFIKKNYRNYYDDRSWWDEVGT